MLVKFHKAPVEAGAIFFPPEPLWPKSKREPKAIDICPAVQDFSQRTYSIKAPFTFRLVNTGTAKEPQVRLDRNRSTISFGKLKGLLSVNPRSDWRSPLAPILQIETPYFFSSDYPVHMIQRHPYQLIGGDVPFRVVEGGFRVDKWKRPLAWAVEWIRPGDEIQVHRGDPWFDVTFFPASESAVKLEEAPFDESMEKDSLSARHVTNYVKGTKRFIL